MNRIFLISFIFLSLIVRISFTNVKLQTQQGIIYGRQTQKTIEYLGIQYATAERWKPPVDLASEKFPNDILNATLFGPCCPQPKSVIFIPKQDEQCLYLNIFKPIVSSNHSLLPVFVWIHGGAHSSGCTSQSIPLLFNGTNMITNSPSDQPVIIITLDYRLGILADMFLEELIEEDPQWPTAGNYMYLDMLSALRWIQKNIEDYGGDRTNVRLFGQSAGGLSVVDLGAVRGSSGLYRTALSQSGLGSPGTYTSYYNMSNALNYSNSVVDRLNCSNNDKSKVLTCLRNKSIDDLFKSYINRYTRPIIDKYFFPLYPPLAILNGTYNNISLIMGNNDFEEPICFEYPQMDSNAALNLLTENIGQKWIESLIEIYPISNCSSNINANTSRCCDIVRRILMEQIFDCSIRRLFNGFYGKYGSQSEINKLFWYNLNCHPSCPSYPDEGICRHGSELAFVFGTMSNWYSTTSLNCTWDNQTRTFSNDIIAHWMNAAATGKPLAQWFNYDPVISKYFHMTPEQDFVSISWSGNCSIFDQIEAEGVKETFRT